MTTRTYLSILAILLFLGGCKTAQYYHQTVEDVDFNRFETYAFLPDMDTSDFSVYNSDIVRKKTVKNIKDEMEDRGFKMDVEDPDLLILPHFMFDRKIQTVYEPIYPTYNYWYSGFVVTPWYIYYYPGYTHIPQVHGDEFRQIDYTEGTIVVDVIENTDGHDLLWRGWSEDKINPNTFSSQIEEYIENIFYRFPVNEKGIL